MPLLPPKEKSSDGQDDEAKAAEEEAEAAADKEMEAARGMTDIRDLRATLSSICGDLSVSRPLCPLRALTVLYAEVVQNGSCVL